MQLSVKISVVVSNLLFQVSVGIQVIFRVLYVSLSKHDSA